MIQRNSILEVTDNSGANRAKCIGIPGHSGKNTARVGDIIKCSIVHAKPNGKIKKGSIHNALIVRTVSSIRKNDGTCISFSDNAVILMDEKYSIVGTSIFGTVVKESIENINGIPKETCAKIMSIAGEVI